MNPVSVTFQLSDPRQVAAPPRVPSDTQDWDKNTVFLGQLPACRRVYDTKSQRVRVRQVLNES